MRLTLACERCGAERVIFTGHLIDIPQGLALTALIAAAHDSHRCPAKPEGATPHDR